MLYNAVFVYLYLYGLWPEIKSYYYYYYLLLLFIYKVCCKAGRSEDSTQSPHIAL